MEPASKKVLIKVKIRFLLKITEALSLILLSFKEKYFAYIK